MYSDQVSGVVIPFPRAARMSASRGHRPRMFASPHAARQREAAQIGAWRGIGGDLLALAGTLVMAAAQASLLLRAFGLRLF